MPVIANGDGAKVWTRRTTAADLTAWFGWFAGVALTVLCFQFISDQTIWAFVWDAPRQAADLLDRAFPPRWAYVHQLWRAMWDTINIATLGTVLAIAIGVPAGVIAAKWRGSTADIVVSVLSMASVAMPYFWAGILLIIVFSLHLGWLPSSGYVPFSTDPLRNLELMLLPSITIGTAFAGLIMRQVRGAMLEVLSFDYIRTARAKGASETRVVFRHGLRNALIPVITVIGLQIGALLGGAVVVEAVFSLPGLGSMMVESIFSRDYPAIQGAVLFSVCCVLLVTVLVDMLYAVVDPRIEY